MRFLVLLSLAAAAFPQAPSKPYSYSCPRAAAPIRIDGKLDDPSWQAAPWTADLARYLGGATPAHAGP